MKVCELIEKLQAFDPNMEVEIGDLNWGVTCPIRDPEVGKHTEGANVDVVSWFEDQEGYDANESPEILPDNVLIPPAILI